MKPLRNGRALIIELMIIILFFSLSSVIVVRLFATADQFSRQSTESTALLQTAQSWADRLLAEDDFSGFLAENGWIQHEDGLSLAVGSSILSITHIREEKGASGSLQSCELSAYTNQQLVFTLPVARYAVEETP